MDNDISADGANVMPPLAKLLDVEHVAPAHREAQKQMWHDYCCMVDDELRNTERRVVPDAGPYVASGLVIALVFALAVLLP